MQPVKAYWQGTVYIRADGSVDPTWAPITSLDNFTYVLTDDIFGSVVIYRDNIVIEGAGHTLLGNETGIDLKNRDFITVKNLIIRGFSVGVSLQDSDSNNITGNTIRDCSCGLDTYGGASDFNIIRSNTLLHNNVGIRVWIGNANNEIYWNTISDNFLGIEYDGSFNKIYGNNIMNNHYGFSLWGSEAYGSGAIYHNNFMHNTVQVEFHGDGYNSIWDDGFPSGGNYWSDYSGPDSHKGRYQNETGSDGVGDTPYSLPHGYQDNFPLASPFYMFYASTSKGVDYYIYVVSNSTVSQFHFNPDSAAIMFNATGEAGATGFCRVTIPKNLLWTEDKWTILVEGENVSYTIVSSETDTYLFLMYSHSTKTITIKGTGVIPEFPSFLVLALLVVVATSFAVVVYRKKRISIK
jgi:parallel beta-helix repeat protein